jgi:Site-specific recombinase XerD
MATEEALIKFFESNEVSTVNQEIVLRYFQKTMRKKSASTIEYNISIMQFVLTYIKTDLDKLTIDDVEDYQTAVDDWKHKKDGTDIADSTKSQYIIGFKRFLNWYGKKYNKTYFDLSDNLEKYGKAKGKVPSDMLTKDEILKMIDATNEPRDKAMIAVLAESGCRIGELLSCRVKDIERTRDGVSITFPGGKTGSRTVFISYMAGHLFRWLEVHPDKHNPEAPLWSTKNKKKIAKESNEEAYQAINYHTCYGMLQRVVQRAGITKKVHPHLFRHTRATTLAKSLNEPILRQYLGWKPGSMMPAIYLHISNTDAELAIKELYGLIDKKSEKGFQVGKCPRCQAVVPVEAQYCGTCGMPLAKDTQVSLDATAEKLLDYFKQHPEMLALIAKQS